MQPDMAMLRLPFANSLITNGTTIHGGAIASLIDTAAMVAAWADDSVPENMRGTTVSLSVTYLAPAEHEDIQATAQVLRRGRSLVYLDVEVQSVSGKRRFALRHQGRPGYVRDAALGLWPGYPHAPLARDR